MSEKKHRISFSQRELDTVIAALRFWQDCGQPADGVAEYANEGLREIATNCGQRTALSSAEIDELIEERINA